MLLYFDYVSPDYLIGELSAVKMLALKKPASLCPQGGSTNEPVSLMILIFGKGRDYKFFNFAFQIMTHFIFS